MNCEKVRVYGKIENFKGNILEGADIKIMDRFFEEKYTTVTDENGEYEMFVEPGEYASFFACKDYGVDNLEYWAWNVPISKDTEINAKIDGLELYGMNAFRVQGAAPNRIMIYLRPMSLKKGLLLMESGEIETAETVEMAPTILKEHTKVEINEKEVKIYSINRVLESVDENQNQVAYLIHVEFPEGSDVYEYNKITMTLHDMETDESGQGTLYWKEEEII